MPGPAKASPDLIDQDPRTARAERDAYQAEHARLLSAFGAKLRAERDRRNVSQETLAEIANVHRTHLAALERGKRDPHLSMLLILADTLKVTPGALLEGLPRPRERKAPTHSKNGTVTGGDA